MPFSLVLFLCTTSLCHSQVTIYYDNTCSITMKDLATHYRIAEVDTAKGTFSGEVKDYWMNDSIMAKLTYSNKGKKDGSILIANANGEIKIKGQYTDNKKRGTWEINEPSQVIIDFNKRDVASNKTIDSIEFCISKKEEFTVGEYIRRADYAPIRPLVEMVRTHKATNDGSFSIVEERPRFPNGLQALGAFIGRYIQYPEEAVKNNIKGQVIVAFTIREDGSTSDFKIMKSVGYGCDEEAIRVLKLLPDWIPGYQRGRPVKTKFTIPITFDNGK